MQIKKITAAPSQFFQNVARVTFLDRDSAGSHERTFAVGQDRDGLWSELQTFSAVTEAEARGLWAAKKAEIKRRGLEVIEVLYQVAA